MTLAMELLRAARAAGITFALENGDKRVRFFGPPASRATFKSDITARVDEVIALLQAERHGRVCDGCGVSALLLVSDAGCLCRRCRRPVNALEQWAQQRGGAA